MSGTSGLRKHGHTTDGDGGTITTAHPNLATHDALGLATDVELSTHTAVATAHHTNANDPSSGQKAALAGTSGTPGGGNTYVTDADARNTNARTPSAHATSHKSGGSDPVKLNELAAPTADVDLNSHKITNVADPASAQDAATKAYVDASGGGTAKGARVYNSGAFAVGASTETAITFDSERTDSDAFHSTGSNTARLTIPTGGQGRYTITGSVEWAASALGTLRRLSIRLNGTTYIAKDEITSIINAALPQNVSTIYDLAAGDYVELVAFQDTVGSVNLQASGNYSPEFGLSLGGASTGSGSVATDTIFDAKGDLAVGTGADAAAKLTVGANDTIPMADSGETTGIKWVGSQTPSTQAFSDAAAQGTADTYARGDHKHGMPASPGGSGPAGELGYASIMSDITTTSDSLTVATGLTVTVTIGSRAVHVMAFFPEVRNSSSNLRTIVELYDDTASTRINWLITTSANAADNGQGQFLIARVAPSAGSRTYKVRWQRGDGSGTSTIRAGATFPAWVGVYEV